MATPDRCEVPAGFGLWSNPLGFRYDAEQIDAHAPPEIPLFVLPRTSRSHVYTYVPKGVGVAIRRHAQALGLPVTSGYAEARDSLAQYIRAGTITLRQAVTVAHTGTDAYRAMLDACGYMP